MVIPCEKMILAVLSGDDSADVIQDLNRHGYYVTVLSSSGGFLRKRNVTLMIGLEEARVAEALSILRTHAGTRMETTYLSTPTTAGIPAVPVSVQTGGTVAFVLSVESCNKY